MTPLPVTPADAARFRALVRARIGIRLADARTPDLERAVQLAAAAADLTDADALHELLSRRAGVGAPLDAFVAGLNLSETHFFRDANQIQALEQRIVPELIAGRSRQRRLRVWSAGCSTGEEAYTLAILIHRLLPDLPDWDVVVLGTDLNGRALRRARRGVYRAWSLRGMPESAQASYLRPHAEGVEVTPAIRAMVTFARLNLTEDCYPSPASNTHAMDLILCRNVLLYFGEAEARAVVRRLRAALRDGGWLLLSGVEAGLGVIDGLDRSDPAPAAFRRSRRASPDGELGRQPSGPEHSGPERWRPEHSGPERSGPPPGPERWRPEHSGPERSGPPPGPEHSGPAPPPGLAPPPNQAPAAPTVHPAPAGSERDRQATACARALRVWRDGQRSLALGVLAAEADRDPLRPEVHYLYGLILLDSGRPAEALAAFRRCTYLDPGFALGHLGQAGLLARSGERRRAGTALDNAARLVAKLDPDVSIPALDGPRVAEVCELIAAQRRLLDPGPGSDTQVRRD